MLFRSMPTPKAGSSSTTEGSKERPRKLSMEEEEKKMLQKLAQGLEQMSVEQNEYVTMLKEECNSRNLKRRRTLGSDHQKEWKYWH